MLAVAVGILPVYLVATVAFRWLALQASLAFASPVVPVACRAVARLLRRACLAVGTLVPAPGI